MSGMQVSRQLRTSERTRVSVNYEAVLTRTDTSKKQEQNLKQKKAPIFLGDQNVRLTIKVLDQWLLMVYVSYIYLYLSH